VIAGVCAIQAAVAKPGGEPLVLDTQTGIHSGAPGMVLQSAPLNSPGLVGAQPMPGLPGPPQQEQAPIIVSPYVEMSAAQGGGISGGGRPSHLPHNHPGGKGRGGQPGSPRGSQPSLPNMGTTLPSGVGATTNSP
jgi:hypothetical protein